MGIEDRAGAWRLVGLELESGWRIIEPVGWDPKSGVSTDHYNGTGGNFSVPYIVEKNGKKAFLKAIDLTDAMNASDVFQKLREITEAHAFEISILKMCGEERMNRVVVAIESGEVRVGENLQDAAPYLIFELADGDVRRKIQKVQEDHKFAWWLKAMHHASVGLSQLHSKGITHQDLKPSNVLAFGGIEDFKIADLGRSTCEGTPAPHEAAVFSGDWGYAPPELVYMQVEPDIRTRRLCTDLYLLGSLVFFFVRGFGCTALLMESLAKEQRPAMFGGGWTEGYQRILPVLNHSFTKLLDDLRRELPHEFADSLVSAAHELCNPNPTLRGHPLEKSRSNNQFQLQRYVSLFDRLAKRASIYARAQSRK